MARKNSMETAKRSLGKSLTFRIGVITTDAVITYALTRRYDITIGFVVFTNLASTVLYYVHERAWARINWGRSK